MDLKRLFEQPKRYILELKEKIPLEDLEGKLKDFGYSLDKSYGPVKIGEGYLYRISASPDLNEVEQNLRKLDSYLSHELDVRLKPARE